MQPAARAAPLAKFAIMMRYQGKERTTDIPLLPSAAIEVLALEAMSRDLDIVGLIGQTLVATINKVMIHKDNALRRSRPLRPNTSSHFSFLIVARFTRGGRTTFPAEAHFFWTEYLLFEPPRYGGSFFRRLTWYRYRD